MHRGESIDGFAYTAIAPILPRRLCRFHNARSDITPPVYLACNLFLVRGSLEAKVCTIARTLSMHLSFSRSASEKCIFMNPMSGADTSAYRCLTWNRVLFTSEQDQEEEYYHPTFIIAQFMNIARREFISRYLRK